MFCCCCFLGSASFLQLWPGFIVIFSTKVGVAKDFPAHCYKESCVKGREDGPRSTDGSVREIHTVVIQGLIVCLFLLNYFSFKNMEMESVKSRYFVQ